MTTTIGYILARLIAVAIIVIGARFVVAPGAAATGYGVQADPTQQSTAAYLRAKGIRDIASGLLVLIVMATGESGLLGWIILAANIIPIADTAIVLTTGGPRSIAWGIHGLTAAIMLATSALLLTA